MPELSPSPISPEERRSRIRRIRRVADRLGFEGRIEYRHVLSGTGGAQYGVGYRQADDLLVVFAEAFERDADEKDFSLEAILAHERGHQILVRNRNVSPILRRGIGLAAEEVLASLIGSLIADREQDRQDLYYKALFESVTQGMEPTRAVSLLHDLRLALERAI